MPSHGSNVEYALRFTGRRNTYTAVCGDDACPWKHRGVTVEATHIAAERHVQKSGHAVTVYEECRTTIEADGAR